MKEPVYLAEDLTMEDLYPHFRTGQSYSYSAPEEIRTMGTAPE